MALCTKYRTRPAAAPPQCSETVWSVFQFQLNSFKFDRASQVNNRTPTGSWRFNWARDTVGGAICNKQNVWIIMIKQLTVRKSTFPATTNKHTAPSVEISSFAPSNNGALTASPATTFFLSPKARRGVESASNEDFPRKTIFFRKQATFCAISLGVSPTYENTNTRNDCHDKRVKL